MVASPEKKGKKKNLAEESSKTKKAREKLHRRMRSLDAKITSEALQEKTIEIQRWIARHADHRVALRNKAFSLFDENQNAAKLSIRIAKIAKRLQEEAISD